MQINDLQLTKLRALGYSGALPDMLSEYKADNGIENWFKWYGSQGRTEPQFSDRAYQFWFHLVV